MKPLAILSSIILAIAVSYPALAKDNGDGTYTNPPLNGDYPDPDIIRVGDTFYFASSTFCNSPGLVILQSKDLVNWKTIGYVIDRLDGDPKFDLVDGGMYRNGVFAPSLRYHEGTFYVAVTLNGKPTRIYYSKDPAGNWKYNDLGDSAFDPGLFFDDDGTPYIFTSMTSQGVVTLKTLSPQLDKVIASRKIHSSRGIEGCKVIKTKGWYYLFNANPSNMSLMTSRAKSLDGPWEIKQVLNDSKGGHQGAIVDLPNGDFYGFVMCDKGAIGRVTNISPITWQDEWPVWGEEGSGRVPTTAKKPIQGQPIVAWPAAVEFDQPKLPLEWLWNHNPDNARWSLSERPGFLRLKPTVAPDFWNARNSFTHKGVGPKSCADVTLDISHLEPGDCAGLGMIGKGITTLTIQRSAEGQVKLSLANGSQGASAVAEKATAEVPGKPSSLHLALQMDFGTRRGRCAYSVDGKEWTLVGEDFNLLWDWRTGTFQGEQYAIFCYNPKESKGYLDVDSVRFPELELKKP
jgi:beta-xylosidase